MAIKKLWLILLLSTASVFCMEFNKAALLYVEKCKKIDVKNEQKIHDFLNQACETGLEKARKEIENKIECFEKKLLKRQESLFLADKKKYNIPDEQWEIGVKYAQELDNLKKTAPIIMPIMFDVVHDLTLSPLFLSCLREEMVRNDLNPQMFNIKAIKENAFSGLHCEIWFGIENNVLKMEIVKAGHIEVSRELVAKMNNCLQIQKDFCAHLITSMVARKSHPLVLLTGLEINKTITNKQANEGDFNDVIITRPFTLEYVLKNQRMCELLKSYHLYSFSSANTIVSEQELSENTDYFKELCKINRLQKILSWLKEYTQY